MRKFILIAALVLASASAQAAGSRSLTLASSDDQATAATEQPKPADTAQSADAPKAVEETKPAETPKYADRPAAVNTATDTPKADAAVKAAPVQKTERRKPRRDWTEARIIGELHRHGIYW
jgi:hypothetical protein